VGVDPVRITRADMPEVVAGEYMEEIRHALTQQPRSQQVAIGPSEIGNPCSRALIHKLAGDPEPARQLGSPDEWRAWVGTQMHNGLQRIFDRSVLNQTAAGARYITERRLLVGHINGTEIHGSCDLYDQASRTVIDHKTKSATRLKAVKLAVARGHGVGDLYRAQAHLYGRGWQLLGHTPHHVMLVFLPRDGNLTDALHWAEPYDETIATAALDRCTGLAQLIAALGVAATLDLYPDECADDYCAWCRSAPRKFSTPSQQPTSKQLLASLRAGTVPAPN